MDNILILSIGGEGAGADIYGAHEGSDWTFWREGACMDFDENDEEVWRSYTTEPVSDFLSALPMHWWMLCPTDPPHAAFVDRLREEYARCCKTMDENFFPRLQRERWTEALTPSDLQKP
jgi:hypothetical protein